MPFVPGASQLVLQPALSRSKRPYVRKNTTNTSGLVFPTSPPQLAEFAFNVHGWALEDGVANRGTFEVINAYKPTMTKGGFEAKINEFKSQGDVYRNDLEYTAREIDTTLSDRDSAVCQYLVVGYTLQEEDPIFVNNKDFSRYSDNELVGESWPTDQHLIKWASCRTPILVVTPIKENTGTSVRLFGLVKPRSGLCQPVLLTHERIFYRWEYRASAGAKYSQRNKNWNHLIILKARQLTPPDTTIKEDDGNEQKRPAKRTRSGAAIKQEVKQEIKQEVANNYILEPLEADDVQGEYLELNLNLGTILSPASRQEYDMVLPLMAEVMSNIKIANSLPVRDIVATIRASNTDHVLQAIASAITKVEMPRVIPAENAVSLAHFSYLDTIFGLDEAHGAVDEIKALWPQLIPLVEVNKILHLKYAMSSIGLIVELETMETFFTNALAYITLYSDILDPNLAFKLGEFHQMSSMLHQSRVMVASNSPLMGDDGIFLTTLLRDFLQYDAFQVQATDPGLTQGRLATPLALLKHSWEYNLDFDIIQCRHTIDATVREVFDYAKAKNCGLEDILLWLGRLRMHIRMV